MSDGKHQWQVVLRRLGGFVQKVATYFGEESFCSLLRCRHAWLAGFCLINSGAAHVLPEGSQDIKV